MAYTILKSDGSVLCSIADGTINTTSTPLGLPGRNYAGYGQVLDTNVVHMLENFADSVPPSNPLMGQLWFDTNTNSLKICPADGDIVSANWYTISSTNANGLSVFSAVTVTGDLTANNATITNDLTVGNTINTVNLTVSGIANIATANIGNTITRNITTGGSLITGNIDGAWSFLSTTNLGAVGNVTITGGTNGQYLQTNGSGVLSWATINTSLISNGSSNVSIPAINGNVNISSASVPNVVVVTGTGVVITGSLNTNNITTGSSATAGNITGNWTLTSGSRLQATYADIAERFASEVTLEPGTVVELGGSKEVRAVRYELSEDVFGVVSDTAAYLLNSQAGSDETHPPIAMSGRVTVKVKGKVNKGQRLVSAGNGLARAANEGEVTAFNTIGRALEDKTSDDVGTVLAIVIIK